MSNKDNEQTMNFIRKIITEDLSSGKHQRIVTRFPPEPNGYLHIGHAKSICLNFGIAADFKGQCNLRFDDTNPNKENPEFVQSIQSDVRWLGYDWGTQVFFASDYFEQLYDFAVGLIRQGKAYVCDLSADQVREYRGTLTQPGKDSPSRERSVEENLDLFLRMRKGEFKDGEKVLRAKIDMSAPNMNLRDPALYRIRHDVVHHQTGTEWCIYPMYDFTHPLSDALEGITHSLCTLEFEDHRPLYDWLLENTAVSCRPRQIEFSRLNLEYTVMSKRKLTTLVTEGHVDGWDDPRMPTIAGLRRRGYTAASIQDFCARIGITKAENRVEMGVLENCIREDLNVQAPRRMAVLHPLKVIIDNYPENSEETLAALNHPQNPDMGVRQIKMSREIYIDCNDFLEIAPNKKFKRLVSGGEVRLRYGYVIRCTHVIKDNNGEIIALHCDYDPATLGSNPVDRKVKGVIHWVSAQYGLAAEIRLYDRLFKDPMPDLADAEYTELLNPDSLQIVSACIIEPELRHAQVGEQFQFEREGYFCLDHEQKSDEKPVFNRVVSLRDAWSKIEKQAKR